MKRTVQKFIVAGALALALAPHALAQTYVNPVIPGDYPDPSVIRAGKTYYATATTSEWAPLFPILKSTDMVNWENVGAVFQRRPEWSVGNFWAPEIAEFNGKYFIYYVGRKKDGPLSIAVATANKPEGPYTDHGILISQAAGSIDAFPIEDEQGQRWLIWKEDGNSRKLPTILWIQRLSADGLRLEGEMKEIMRNDVGWEGNVVEGPAVIRKGGYYYMFYAANACCGRACHYGVGVARAKTLTGPWEKYSNNPVVQNNELWKCPGHGTLVQGGNGDWYFMYHAYHADDWVYVGRQAVLSKIDWREDGWPVVNENNGVIYSGKMIGKVKPLHSQYKFQDGFSGKRLNPEWQWPQQLEPVYSLKGGKLRLQPNASASNDMLGGVMAVKTASGNYTATTVITRKSITPDSTVGFSAFGDVQNALGVAFKGSELSIWRRAKNKTETLAASPAPEGKELHLRLEARYGHKFKFSASADGKNWREIGAEVPLEGDYLPPWDRGIRIALTVGGSPGASAEFDSMNVDFQPPRLDVEKK